MDLLDFIAGRQSMRRLGVVLRNLPNDSATKSAMRDALSDAQYAEMISGPPGNEHGRWSLEASLLARVADLLGLQIWQAGGNKGPQPEPLPRPGVARVASVTPINEQAIRYLLATRELRGGLPTREVVLNG